MSSDPDPLPDVFAEADALAAEQALREEVLAQCKPFAGLSSEVLSELASAMEERSFAQDETFIRQGDAGDSLILIREGNAVARIHRPHDSTQGFAYFGVGDVVGEMALLIREPRNADIVALSPVSALSLSAKNFERLAARYPELGVVLTSLVAKRLGSSSVDGLAGKLIGGRYEIVRAVGRGGMAVVYEARDLERERRVALKMMSHRLIYDPDALRRFQREAAILGRLMHPNIARMLRQFSAYRTYFIVLEFCPGPTLEELVQEIGPLAEPRCRAIISRLAAALMYLHESGVLHRDLKPSNVIVTEGSNAKVTDFGLARHSSGANDTQLTDRSAVLGTPQYLAPEQFAGAPHTTESDVYALGCVALFMLEGATPFQCARVGDLIQLKATYVPPPADQLGTGVSEELRDFIATALATNPDDRNVDLAAVADW